MKAKQKHMWFMGSTTLLVVLVSLLISLPTLSLADNGEQLVAGSQETTSSAYTFQIQTTSIEESFPTAEETAAYMDYLGKMAYEDGVDTYAELEVYRGPSKDAIKKRIDTKEAELRAAREREARRQAAIAAEKARKQAVVRPSSSGGDVSVPEGSSHGGVWSRSQVAATLRAAANSYGLSASDTEWIVSAGCSVAYKESTYNTQARNGQHLGLFQFNNNWGSAANRLDGTWSCYRFVRVFRDGGKTKIRQHWAATI